jgi:hypothetical protein
MRGELYYSPGKYGLELVAEEEYSSGSYEFDIRAVWRDTETGKLLTARDSGCSCPTPFEDYTSKDDLEPFILREIEDEAIAILAGRAMDFLTKIRAFDEERKRS